MRKLNRLTSFTIICFAIGIASIGILSAINNIEAVNIQQTAYLRKNQVIDSNSAKVAIDTNLYDQLSHNTILPATEFAKLNQKKQIKAKAEDNTSTCKGEWVNIPSVGIEQNFGHISISEWDWETEPSILHEYVNASNMVLLGHNNCMNGNCDLPTTNFSQIIDAKPGDKVEACLNGKLINSEITVSKSISEKDVYILSNWLNTESVTMFTCFGDCLDENCERISERWVVAFKR